MSCHDTTSNVKRTKRKEIKSNVKIAGLYTVLYLRGNWMSKICNLSMLLNTGTQPKHLGAAVVEMRSGNVLGVTRFVQVQ